MASISGIKQHNTSEKKAINRGQDNIAGESSQLKVELERLRDENERIRSNEKDRLSKESKNLLDRLEKFKREVEIIGSAEETIGMIDNINKEIVRIKNLLSSVLDHSSSNEKSASIVEEASKAVEELNELMVNVRLQSVRSPHDTDQNQIAMLLVELQTTRDEAKKKVEKDILTILYDYDILTKEVQTVKHEDADTLLSNILIAKDELISWSNQLEPVDQDKFEDAKSRFYVFRQELENIKYSIHKRITHAAAVQELNSLSYRSLVSFVPYSSSKPRTSITHGHHSKSRANLFNIED